MSALSPALKTGLQLKLELSANGKVIHTDHIASVETWCEANRIPRARIVLYDGAPDSLKFPFSEGDSFVPGAKLTVSAGYGEEAEIIHQGVVVRQGLRIQPHASAQLVVETVDPLLKMTLARHSAVTEQATDKAVIEALVTANGGTIGKNAAGTLESEAMVQAYASDWDLMLMRAEASGCIVVLDNGSVDILSPNQASAPVLALAYGAGNDIISFDGRIDAEAQLGQSVVTSRAWSYADQAVSEGSAQAASLPVPGNLDAAELAAVMDVPAYAQQTAALRARDALAAWSSAAMMRARLAHFTGTVKFQGSAKVKPGSVVTLDGLGERMSGDAYVTGVRHVIRGGDWHSIADLGMTPDRFSRRGDDAAGTRGAAGLAPPLKGLHIGKVVQVAEDPTGDFRVQVTLPLTDALNQVWARLGQPYASQGFGWSFLPEADDEVVLAFLNEDPASAVILGSLYSGGRAPTHAPENPNDVKALVTRSKMEVNFNDKDVVLKISTPGGRFVELDDKTGTLIIADPNDNKLVMKSDTVDLLSAANLTIKSGANMTLDCGANLAIKAAATCDMEAVQLNATASAQLALASNGLASLKAAAVLEVNGALVKIN
ncbi:phage baseplate assembly protein V [Sphingomonas sp. IC-56]|uniref:phage baseplate assembly protein V n=1 Tax=Sphingomonas sp. IC-56 TaxID=2898529 RepID=UPI001E33C645|nr:phage baseplate assembly protein V [Sphingomonas sp. IC-56]MCD2324180.1 phage baseplate assembly protein V [Sphingomonas sp. IC-56]